MSILDAIPKGWEPRPVQVNILKEIEEKWDKADVFVIRLPVAGGKSLISVTLARYANMKKKWKARILAPNNMLVNQYLSSFPGMNTLRKRDSYTCVRYENEPVKYDCGAFTKMMGTAKKRAPYCKGCPYVADLRKAKVMPYVVLNYYTYLAYKMYGPALIVDEGHLLQNMLKDMAAKKIWKHEYHYPGNIYSYGKLYDWTVGELKKKPKDKKLLSLKEDLERNKVRYLVEKGTGYYRGEERECLKLIPVDVKDQPPLLWPQGTVKKIFLLSGTINRKDVDDMGLGDRRVAIIDAPSPIPVERRPLHLDLSFTLAARYQDKQVPELAHYLLEAIELNPTRGFIHAPYSLAKKLQPILSSNSRVLFHTSANKHAVFQRFQNSEDAVMVASGMYEGIDLADELARWQIITKVPWANLTEPAIAYMAKEDPEGYANEAVRLVVQAYGRVCRGPEDYGATTIVDTSFKRLFTTWKHLFPKWFIDAIISE